MRLWAASVACLAIWLTSVTAQSAPTETRRSSTASARADGRKVVYVQKMHERWSDGRLVAVDTDFFDAEGRAIAKRRVRVGASPLFPDESFEELRSGYRTESRLLPGGKVEVKVRSEHGEAIDRKLLRPTLQPVNAAGVVEAIRAHWGRLSAGGKVDIALIVPQRLDWYRFRLRKAGKAVHQGRPTTTIILEPDSGLLRAIAGQLRFELDDASGGLVRYRGQVDLHDQDGDPFEIDIAWTGTLPGARPAAEPPPAVAGPGAPQPPRAP